MAAAVNIGGGGVHPGHEPIWPTLKPVKSVQQAQETVQTSRDTKVQTAPQSAVSSAETATSGSQPAATVAAQPAVRAMEMQDILNSFIQNGIPDTAENRQLAVKMLEFGIELSPANFNDLMQALAGSSSDSDMNAAVISLNKGLNGMSGPVQILANFLNGNPAILADTQQLQAIIARLQGAMGMYSGSLPAGLMAAISSAVGMLNREVDKQLKKISDDDPIALATSQSASDVADLITIREFFGNLMKQFRRDPRTLSDAGKSVYKELSALSSKISALADRCLAESILSQSSLRAPMGQEDNYLYFQIPNPWAVNKNIEILIKRDSHKDQAIDPKKTRLVIKLETEDLGEIIVMLDRLDKKVWAKFYVKRDRTRGLLVQLNPDFKNRLESIALELVRFQSVVESIDIDQLVIPRVRLDSVVRIMHEV